MAWTTPKTTWEATDPITYVDYNRIVNNLKYIQELCRKLYALSITDLGSDKTESDVPYADMLNNIETCLTKINRASYNFAIGREKSFSANSPYFDYTELNRIESATLRLNEWLESQTLNLPKLAIRLGNIRGIKV